MWKAKCSLFFSSCDCDLFFEYIRQVSALSVLMFCAMDSNDNANAFISIVVILKLNFIGIRHGVLINDIEYFYGSFLKTKEFVVTSLG